ncbi:hypothetical protein AJ78_05543 [Emergomyces pasteurianus Ep9510]|uniref:Peptidase C14 caspase domain-containing protein n=1 Tax=Emergomyces pasteurianus Ep9510 TaxID=1447872 RepID=A0A1J9PDI2_9EURO|nr:hypothetical protein AJ78_05543 [Emergomyces pasteurianus Ep9510]
MADGGIQTQAQHALDAYYPADRGNLPLYDSVSVLLLLWEDDHLDLKCGNEVKRLSDIFAKSYGYSTKILRIPITYSETWLFDVLIDFARGKTARDLLIVYYAGHGKATSAYLKYIVNLCAPPEVRQKWVNTTGGREYMCTRPSDVLFLLDCCQAAGAASRCGKGLIAACGIESDTRSLGYFSFTTALVQELEHASATGEYLTRAILYRNLLQKAFNGSLKSSPIHAEFSPAGRSSILLTPQRPSDMIHPTPAMWPNSIPVSVVLAVQLRDAASSTALSELRSWLIYRRPSCVEKTKLGSSCESGSCTVIFELPIEVWYCLTIGRRH